MNKKVKIPKEIKELFNQEYLDLNQVSKLFFSNNIETKNFFEEIIPIIKEFLKHEFPIINMLNLF